MNNRSDIDLIANATSGVNLGTGDCIFKCKNITGNTLQFKTISAVGSLSIIATGDTMIISGKTGGGSFPVLTGMTDYLIKATTTGITISSIYDSGTTDIHICKDNLIVGTNSLTPSIVKAYGGICLGLQAVSNIFFSNGTDCIRTDGSSLCSGTYSDFTIKAGNAISGVGKALILRGGNGISAIGGNVVLCGGSGSSNGRIQTPNLPAKSTETCAVYIDASGNLSKGLVGTGSTTISGTADYVGKFNPAGNNIINSSILDSGTTETKMLKDCITLGNPTSISTCVRAHNHATQPVDLVLRPGINLTTTCTGYLYLDAGKSPVPTIYLGSSTFAGTQVNVQPAGTQSNIMLILCSKGNERLDLFANNGIEFGKPSNWACYNGDCLYKVSFNDFCIFGADNNNISATANSTYLRGGDAVNTGGVGGNLILRAGKGIATTGRTYICNLPNRTTETCGIFIDSNKRLSIGIISGGSGGGGGTITGATNGLGVSGKNVCLGGLLTGTVLLCGNATANNLVMCSINTACCNNTSVSMGIFSSNSSDSGTQWCTTISNGNLISLNAVNFANTCGNMIVMRPDATYLCVCNASTGFQYAADYCNKFNNNLCAIPDVNWIKRYTIGGWSNQTCGSTVMGCNTMASGLTKCNTYFGVCAGRLTTGCNNTGIGTSALVSNTTGNFNVALGSNALYTNTIGNNNIAIGCQALYSNLISSDNIAIGLQALCKNTGYYNIGIGSNALTNNLGGGNNVGIGYQALYANTTGNFNIAIGGYAMNNNSSGVDNVANGTYSLFQNTTGGDNVGIGKFAITCNCTGSRNVGVGSAALNYNISSDNTAIGYRALYINSSGSGNVALGCGAGFNEAGSNKLYIANTSTTSPLIYGEFNNNYLQVNGALAIPYLSLTYVAGTVTWDAYQGINRYMTATGSFTLNITNLRDGMTGDLRLTITAPTTITLPVGSKLNGSVTALPAGTYHLGFVYVGGTLDFNIGIYY